MHSDLSGYDVRAFDMARDPARMADLINICHRADGIDDRSSTQQIAADYRNPGNCDLATDTLLAERDGELVGYTRSVWWQELNGPRVHAMFAYSHPDHRPGLQEALFDWSEARSRAVAGADGAAAATYEGWAEQTRQAWLCDIFERRGYAIDTYGAGMVRPTLDGLGAVDLPDGVEIRPVQDAQLRAIWEADREAFRDHYGQSEATESDYRRYLEDPHFDPSLWQVAWAGDRVVGQVRTFVDEEENDEFDRQRAYTEDISTAREWRKRGIATALITASLLDLRRRGFTEAALGVHTENPTGALRVYESLGYEIREMHATYRKEMSLP